MNDEPQPKEGGLTTGRLVALVIAGLLVWFALTNSQRVPVDFIVFTEQARLIVVIAISAVLGALATLLVGRRRRRRGDG